MPKVLRVDYLLDPALFARRVTAALCADGGAQVADVELHFNFVPPNLPQHKIDYADGWYCEGVALRHAAWDAAGKGLALPPDARRNNPLPLFRLSVRRRGEGAEEGELAVPLWRDWSMQDPIGVVHLPLAAEQGGESAAADAAEALRRSSVATTATRRTDVQYGPAAGPIPAPELLARSDVAAACIPL